MFFTTLALVRGLVCCTASFNLVFMHPCPRALTNSCIPFAFLCFAHYGMLDSCTAHLAERHCIFSKSPRVQAAPYRILLRIKMLRNAYPVHCIFNGGN